MIKFIILSLLLTQAVSASEVTRPRHQSDEFGHNYDGNARPTGSYSTTCQISADRMTATCEGVSYRKDSSVNESDRGLEKSIIEHSEARKSSSVKQR